MHTIKKHQAVGTAKKTYSTGATNETTEEVGEALMSSEPMCNVGVTCGITINTGNYNSVKLQVSLHAPSPPDEIDEVFDFVEGWVDKKLQSMMEGVNGTPGVLDKDDDIPF